MKPFDNDQSEMTDMPCTLVPAYNNGWEWSSVSNMYGAAVQDGTHVAYPLEFTGTDPNDMFRFNVLQKPFMFGLLKMWDFMPGMVYYPQNRQDYTDVYDGDTHNIPGYLAGYLYNGISDIVCLFDGLDVFPNTYVGETDGTPMTHRVLCNDNNDTFHAITIDGTSLYDQQAVQTVPVKSRGAKSLSATDIMTTRSKILPNQGVQIKSLDIDTDSHEISIVLNNPEEYDYWIGEYDSTLLPIHKVVSGTITDNASAADFAFANDPIGVGTVSWTQFTNNDDLEAVLTDYTVTPDTAYIIIGRRSIDELLIEDGTTHAITCGEGYEYCVSNVIDFNLDIYVTFSMDRSTINLMNVSSYYYLANIDNNPVFTLEVRDDLGTTYSCTYDIDLPHNKIKINLTTPLAQDARSLYITDVANITHKITLHQ